MNESNQPECDTDAKPHTETPDGFSLLICNMAATPCAEIFKALEELFGMTEKPEAN